MFQVASVDVLVGLGDQCAQLLGQVQDVAVLEVVHEQLQFDIRDVDDEH